MSFPLISCEKPHNINTVFLNANMDIQIVNSTLKITHEKTPVSFGAPIMIDDYEIDFPGEYEKSGIIAEVHEFGENLTVTRLTVGDRTVLFLPETIESMTSDMTEFAGNVDILLVPGKKELQKVIETIDARVVVPYGAGKSALFGAFGQSVEPQAKRSLKAADFDDEKTIFVDISE